MQDYYLWLVQAWILDQAVWKNVIEVDFNSEMKWNGYVRLNLSPGWIFINKRPKTVDVDLKNW